MKNFIEKGDRMEWTNATGSAVASGALVVVGTILAVAATDIANGEKGILYTEGVFELPKATHATDKAFTQGEKLLYDVSASKFDKGAATPATGDVTENAFAFADAASTAATAYICLCGIPGTVAA